VSQPVGTRLFRKAGGMPPTMFKSWPSLDQRGIFSLTERREIALLRVQGLSKREIGRRLGRSLSTISRELWRNAATRSGGLEYRASTAHGTPSDRAGVERRQAYAEPGHTRLRRGKAGRNGRRFLWSPGVDAVMDNERLVDGARHRARSSEKLEKRTAECRDWQRQLSGAPPGDVLLSRWRRPLGLSSSG
jgi:hypothetical protein